MKGSPEILINSICDPGKMSSTTSFGSNRINVATFQKELEKAARINKS